MPLNIRNRETTALARELATLKGKGITETIHEALENERVRIGADREARVAEKRAFLQALHRRMAAIPRTGLVADKAFMDSLYDE
jgi:antitoxin VapB